MAISHKFLSIVNRTRTNVISTSDVDPFVPSNHTSPVIEYVNDAQSSVTYNSSTGGITIATGGFYHIVFSAYLLSNADRTITVSFKVNGTVVSTSNITLEGAYHSSSTEKTFTYFRQFSDNDTLQVIVKSDGGSSVYVDKGTTLTLLGNLSSFANATRISGNLNVSAEHNPFTSGSLNSNYLINTSADFTTTGSAYGGPAFKYTGSPTGLYLAYANFIVDTTTALTNANVVYRLRKNGSSVYHNTSSIISTGGNTNDPYESSLIALQSLATNDREEATMQFNANSGFASPSSSFSVIGINNEEYISLYANQNSIAVSSSNSIILFKNSSYTSFTTPTTLVTTTGITYNTGSGQFTAVSGGYYYIASSILLDSSTTSGDILSCSYSLRKNATNCTDGTVIWDSDGRVEASEDPVERTITGIYQLAANDTIMLCIKAVDATPTLSSRINTNFTMFRVGSLPEGGGGGGGGGVTRVNTFGGGSSGFSVGSFGSPTSGRTVINGFY